MRSLLRLLPLACYLAVLASVSHAADALTLRVMSFNLRFASDRPPNAWPDRRPVVKHLLTREAPDLIGTQEGVYSQLRDIAADLTEYEWIGLGRAVTGMVIVELLLIAVGLGNLVQRFEARMQGDMLYALVIIIVVEALLLIQAARWLERKVAPWRQVVSFGE